MTRRRLGPRCVLLVTVLVLTGCSSAAAPPPPSTSASSAATSPAATADIASAADVARVMRAAVEPLRSAQVTVNGGATGGAEITGDGTMVLAGGRLGALEVDGPADDGDGALVVRIVDGTAYVRPADLLGTTPTGPWQRVTTTNPAVAELRSAVAAIAAVTDLGPLADAFGGAATFREVGTVGYGIRYSLADFAAGTALSAALGADVRPTNAYVDLDPVGRPRATYVLLTVDGVRYAVRAEWSGFDQPVTIEPPAAGEIAG